MRRTAAVSSTVQCANHEQSSLQTNGTGARQRRWTRRARVMMRLRPRLPRKCSRATAARVKQSALVLTVSTAHLKSWQRTHCSWYVNQLQVTCSLIEATLQYGGGSTVVRQSASLPGARRHGQECTDSASGAQRESLIATSSAPFERRSDMKPTCAHIQLKAKVNETTIQRHKHK